MSQEDEGMSTEYFSEERESDTPELDKARVG